MPTLLFKRAVYKSVHKSFQQKAADKKALELTKLKQLLKVSNKLLTVKCFKNETNFGLLTI